MNTSQHSDKSETNKSVPAEENQSPNEKFKSLLKRVVSLTPEQVEETKRAVPVPKKKNHSN